MADQSGGESHISRHSSLSFIASGWSSGLYPISSQCCCSCSFEAEIIKVGQSSHKMYSNNILNFQESTTILNAYTKQSGNLLNAPRISSCHAASTDIPNSLLPLLPIVHRFWQVVRDASHILTELLYVGSSWSPCFCSANVKGSR